MFALASPAFRDVPGNVTHTETLLNEQNKRTGCVIGFGRKGLTRDGESSVTARAEVSVGAQSYPWELLSSASHVTQFPLSLRCAPDVHVLLGPTSQVQGLCLTPLGQVQGQSSFPRLCFTAPGEKPLGGEWVETGAKQDFVPLGSGGPWMAVVFLL